MPVVQQETHTRRTRSPKHSAVGSYSGVYTLRETRFPRAKATMFHGTDFLTPSRVSSLFLGENMIRTRPSRRKWMPRSLENGHVYRYLDPTSFQRVHRGPAMGTPSARNPSQSLTIRDRSNILANREIPARREQDGFSYTHRRSSFLDKKLVYSYSYFMSLSLFACKFHYCFFARSW